MKRLLNKAFLARTTLIILVIVGVTTLLKSSVHADYIDSKIPPIEYHQIATPTIIDSNQLSNYIYTSSPNTPHPLNLSNDSTSLSEFLGELICNGCEKKCLLTAPNCNKIFTSKRENISIYESRYNYDNNEQFESNSNFSTEESIL